MAEINISAEATAGAQKAAQSEVNKSGGDPSDIDFKMIAQSAAASAAAGGCAALGLAAAAPLCGYVGSEVAGWVIDEAVPAIADAVGEIGDFLGLGKKRPKPILISREGSKEYWETNLASAQVKDVSDVMASAIEKLQALHLRLGLPGPYSTKDVVKRLRDVHGLDMGPRRYSAPPRGNWDYSDTSGCQYVSTAGDWISHPLQNRMECKGSQAPKQMAWGGYYWAPKFSEDFERAGGAELAEARRVIATPKTSRTLRATLAKQVAALVEGYDAKHVRPWEQRLARALAAEAADLEALVVGNKVNEQLVLAQREAAQPQVKRQPRTPPTLRGSTFFAIYTSQMTAPEVEAYRACMRAKVAAAGDGKTRREYMIQCRRQVLGVRATTMADLTRMQTGVSWGTLGLVAAGAAGAAFLLKKRRR